MVDIKLNGNQLAVIDKNGAIVGKHQSQLNFWGFKHIPESKSFVLSASEIHVPLEKLISHLTRGKIPYALSSEVASSREALAAIRADLLLALRQGEAIKDGDVATHRPEDFIDFLGNKIPRKLKEHQIKAALHLLAVVNGANFSVPGSGKTTVVLTVFAWLKHLGLVDSLFVVGPPACFSPWQVEFREVLGIKPSVAVLAGGDIEERRSKYSPGKDNFCDLYLTSFQTIQRDWERVRRLFKERGLRFFLIIDEAHYIKQLDGAWANAVLNVTPFAVRRCILTGTPFPRTYSDSFNLFDALWPDCPPLSQSERIKIESYVQKKNDSAAVATLQKTVGPLFYRVRKQDLGLAPQEFNEPIQVKMGKFERQIYDATIDRLSGVVDDEYFRDVELLMRLKRGRMMRLRQGVSYAKLLGSAVDEYNENLLEGNLPLADIITHYDDLEIPAKLKTLVKLVGKLRKRGEKVLIWSNFVQTLKLIRTSLDEAGHGVRLIYGETPTEASSVQDELTREKIITQFIKLGSGVDVLVANPAACSESISLHKTCSHAIYYDLSYNCAQYLQSLDRIHRVGGSENKIAHYHFLQYTDTIDADILGNLRKKAQNMSAVVDRDYPIYSLDMFAGDDELEAYDRLFKK